MLFVQLDLEVTHFPCMRLRLIIFVLRDLLISLTVPLRFMAPLTKEENWNLSLSGQLLVNEGSLSRVPAPQLMSP